jgi:shikimate kinase
MKPIFLCGFMASGKSTVGKFLAESLGIPFIDTDFELEKQFGKPVSRIFAEDGEILFRHAERRLIQEICTSSELHVIALGGGSLMDEKTLQDVCTAGHLIYLETSLQTTAQRITDASTRPLLQHDLDKLMKERIRGYRAAPINVLTDNRSIEDIALEIRRRLV